MGAKLAGKKWKVPSIIYPPPGLATSIPNMIRIGRGVQCDCIDPPLVRRFPERETLFLLYSHVMMLCTKYGMKLNEKWVTSFLRESRPHASHRIARANSGSSKSHTLHHNKGTSNVTSFGFAVTASLPRHNTVVRNLYHLTVDCGLCVRVSNFALVHVLSRR